MRVRPWLPLVPAIVLAAIAVWESCATVGAADDVPGDAAWRRASAIVRERFAPGDLIVFAPAWNDPVGRLHLGDLIPVDTAARMDAARFATIWELSIRDARAPETAGLTTTDAKTVGGITIRRFTRAPAVVVSDFVALAPTARFGTIGSIAATRSLITGLGLAVAAMTQSALPSIHPWWVLEAWGAPVPVLAEVGFAPHRCLQVVPAPNQSITVTFPAVELGSELVGYAGLADVFKRRDVRDPGELRVTVDGAEVAKVRFGVDSGWVRFAAPTTPGPHAVAFVATAVGPRARDRLICFAAEARR